MNKLKKFCQKPLLFTALGVIAFFMVAVIIMICIPHGKVYKLSYEVDGTTFNYQISLGDKFVSKHTYNLDGKVFNVGDLDGKEYNYEIVDGELFILDGGVSNQKIKIGDIDSRKIILEYNILSETNKTKLVCKANNVLTIIFMVGLYLGIALLVVSLILINLEKKKKSGEIVDVEKNNIESDKSQTEIESVE